MKKSDILKTKVDEKREIWHKALNEYNDSPTNNDLLLKEGSALADYTDAKNNYRDIMIADNIAILVTKAYPDYGTLQDWDHAVLEDGTVQYMLYFSNGGRAAYQTGWDSINIERGEDIPYEDISDTER